jgi:hypothetical protein
MALARASGDLRVAALQGAIGVTAAQPFAAQGAVAGTIALACLALGAAASALERRAQEWVVTALAAHVVLGMAAGLYERSALYDKLVHFAVSFGLARALAGTLAHSVPRWLLALAALGLGASWELFEFAADASGLVTAQRGLADTMLDLGADAAGALLGGLSAWRQRDVTPSSPPASQASPGVPSTPT